MVSKAEIGLTGWLLGAVMFIGLNALGPPYKAEINRRKGEQQF